MDKMDKERQWEKVVMIEKLVTQLLPFSFEEFYSINVDMQTDVSLGAAFKPSKEDLCQEIYETGLLLADEFDDFSVIVFNGLLVVAEFLGIAVEIPEDIKGEQIYTTPF